MKTFNEWLKEKHFNEERFKGLKRLFKKNNPNMPNYVANDLYNNRVGYTMHSLIKNSNSNPSGHRSTNSDLPSDSASKIFKASGFQNSQWTKKPVILTITPLSFSKKTLEFFINRCFGFKEEHRVKNDALRTATQKEIMNSRGTNNEPIIVRQTTYGYDLLEGWHRTMNYLIKGAPEDQLNMLKNFQTDRLNFNLWKPIQIQAYVNTDNTKIELPGTGDFVPS